MDLGGEFLKVPWKPPNSFGSARWMRSGGGDGGNVVEEGRSVAGDGGSSRGSKGDSIVGHAGVGLSSRSGSVAGSDSPAGSWASESGRALSSSVRVGAGVE